MKTLDQVMSELKEKGNPLRIQTFGPHGAPPDLYGVSVADMKKIARHIKGEQELAYELYATGNADAMYLAGMIADGSRMTKALLRRWANRAPWQMVSEYTVPWVATESRHGHALALEWIRSKKESVASSGWNTYSGLVTTRPNEELLLDEIRSFLEEVPGSIGDAPDRVRYTMNGFVIAVGCYVLPLAKAARSAARKLGKVEVDMHGTSCKVPLALESIEKVEKAGRAGKKRKTIKC